MLKFAEVSTEAGNDLLDASHAHVREILHGVLFTPMDEAQVGQALSTTLPAAQTVFVGVASSMLALVVTLGLNQGSACGVSQS